MVIVFYDIQKKSLYVCAKNRKMIEVPIDDPDLLSHIPNDDILYVQNGHFLTKIQFEEWVSGNYEISSIPDYIEQVDEEPDFTPPDLKGKYIHPKHNGTILIQDLPKNEIFPDGLLKLSGKYDFKSVNRLGGFEVLEESNQFSILLAKGKIEVVDYNFVKKYSGKRPVSLADAALDAIIVKNDARGSAEATAAAGGINPGEPFVASGSEAIEINVE